MNTNTTLQVNAAANHIRILELKRLILDSYQAANSLADFAKKKGNEAIAEALLCGQYLNEAKQIVGHGKWLTWLQENMAQLNNDNAHKFMRLANLSHGLNLEDCSSLRQAYITIGILPEPEAAEPKQLSPVWSTALDRVGKLKAQITECPISQWPETEQEQIKTEVKELVALVS